MRATAGDTRAWRDRRYRSGASRLRAAAAAAALAVAVAACGTSSKSSREPANLDAKASYQTLIGAGIHLLRAGNAQAAEQLFQQAIAKDPSDAAGQYDLGVAYQGDGDRRDAFHQYSQALADDPRYVPALFNKAILLSAHNAPLAIFDYRHVIDIQPDSPTAFLNVGLLLSRTRSALQLALFDLNQAVRLDPALRSRIPEPLRSEFAAARPPRLPSVRH